MSKKILIYSGGTVIVTVFLMLSYLSFNVLGITQSRVKRYELTIVTEGAEKIYDGNPLSNSSWYIESGELEDKDSIAITMASTLTMPGTIDNEIGITITDEEGKIVTETYDITLKLGKLTVLPRTLLIQTGHSEKIFDNTPLINTQWSLMAGSLLPGHYIEAVMASNITNPGTINNEIGITILDDQNNNVSLGYDISYELGTLSIIPIYVAIQTESVYKTYDGLPLTGPNWQITDGLVLNNHTIETHMGSTITTPGSIDNDIQIQVFDENNHDITIGYEFNKSLGNLTVQPRALRIETETLEKIYDGQPLSSQNWDIVFGTLSPNHRIEVIMDAMITEPGMISNDIIVTIYDQQDLVVTSYYNIEYLIGELIIYGKELVIITESVEKLYDGTPLASQNWSILEGTLLPNHRVEFVMNSSITIPGAVTNDISLTIYDETNLVVTNKYMIEYIIGILTVHPISIDILTESKDKVFDGLPLDSQGWQIKNGEIALNQHIEFVMNASITNPGTIENTISLSILDDQNLDVTHLYNINLFLGTLTVYSRELVIETSSDSKIYDGVALRNETWTLLNGLVASNHHVEAVMNASITTPGFVSNDISVTILDDANQDVTVGYHIQFQLGYLSVYSREIQIQTVSSSKAYDGTPLVADTWHLIFGTLVDNHHIEAVMTSSITYPGTITNDISITILDEFNVNVSSNYSYSFDLGTLTVDPIPIVIETESDQKIYDGTPLTNENWFFQSGILLANHLLDVNMTSTTTMPGSIYNEVQVTILDEMGKDVSEVYQITYDLGILTVLQRDITIQTETLEKAYDGQPLTSQSWQILSGGLVDTHQIQFIMNATLTYPGSINNHIGVTIVDSENQIVTNGYNITYQLGTLTVLPIAISIQTESLEKVYDGQPLTSNGWMLTSGQLLLGHWIESTMTSTITNPGTVQNSIGIIIRDIENHDVTHNYEITYQLGTLTVLPIELSIQTESLDKVYDGLPLTSSGWTLTSGQLLVGHTIEETMTSTITNPGSVTNDISIQIYDSNNQNVTNQYQIDYFKGNLSVVKRTLTISTETTERTYNGQPLTSNSWLLLSGELPQGHNIETMMASSITNPGTVQNSIGIIIRNEANQDITHNYEITYQLGTLTVLPIELSIQTESLEKVYDGQPLTSSGWTLTSGQLLVGHWIEETMASSITNPGSITNDISIQIYDSNNQNVTNQYQIDYFKGNLSVVKRTITISTETVERTYNGQPLTSNSWLLLSGELLQNHTIQTMMASSITNPGTVQNSIGITIRNEANQDITHNYEITYQLGTLTVLPIELLIQTSSAEKIYDGEALNDPTYNIIAGTILSNHTIEVIMASEITYPGTKVNTVGLTIYDENSVNVNSFYIFNYDYGVLTVHPRIIEIQTESANRQYNGLPLTNPIWTQIGGLLLPNHQINAVMVSAITDPGSIQNTIGITIYDSENNDVSLGYQIEKTLGNLVVVPIPIILQSGTSSKVYDGTPLTDSNYTLLSGEPISGHHLNVVVSGSITYIGTVNNLIYAYVLDNDNNNVNRFYDFEFIEGELTVLSSIYSSNELSTEAVEPSTEDVIKIYSTKYESIYLKDTSWGDYTGLGWTKGQPTNANISINPHNFASAALVEDGKTQLSFQVEYLRSQVPYLLPYYTTNILSGTNDVHIFGDVSTIATFNRVSYAYDESSTIQNHDAYVVNEEDIYKDYVYSTYLSLPESTRQAMLDIAFENGISSSSNSVVMDVKHYIQNAATYTLDFATIPSSVTDIAVYFLTVSQDGICQHFATSATLMYRALGIPARYVTGYLGMAMANIWTTVTGEYAHAWVEIYVDGFGWVPIEVTGGGPGETGGGPGESEVEPIEIIVTPASVREVYVPGKTITAKTAFVSGFSSYVSQGYYYVAGFGGSLSEPGIATSTIESFTIYDALGNDVTDQFIITARTGILQLYQYQLNLYTSSSSKVYDGTALTNNGWYYTGTLGPGHTIQHIEFLGSQTNVGTSKNRATLTIVDEHGVDITSQYLITNNYGNLSVTSRSIKIESASSVKIFDGSALINHDYGFIEGSLASGETIEVIITGSQTSIGSSVNTISSIRIINNGVDVTNNYSIETIEGVLTVQPPY